jgi:hypothetical protein
MPRPVVRTVWLIKRTNAICASCGKRYGKRLIIADPATFRQFWSVDEIVREEKAGYGGLCWLCWSAKCVVSK